VSQSNLNVSLRLSKLKIILITFYFTKYIIFLKIKKFLSKWFREVAENYFGFCFAHLKKKNI
jgi:hypothetical protein